MLPKNRRRLPENNEANFRSEMAVFFCREDEGNRQN